MLLRFLRFLPGLLVAIALLLAARGAFGAAASAAAGAGASVDPTTDVVVLEETEVSTETDQRPAALNGAMAMTNAAADSLRRLWNWSDAQVRGIFDVILPETQERRTLRLSVSPRFRDFINEDHVRLPLSFTYGFNSRAEGEVEFDTYFHNPFKDEGSGNGIGNIRTNFKYRWTPQHDHTVSAATGFSVVRPIPSSPGWLNEGVNRYSVYVTFSRPSPTIENLESFLNLSYDLITPSSATGEIDEDEPQDDFIKTSTGVLYRRKRLTYGLSLAWAHTVDGDRTNFFTVTPSVIWQVPPKYAFNSPGQWQLGASLETKRYGSETDVEFRVRARWRIDLKRFVRDWRDRRIESRSGR